MSGPRCRQAPVAYGRTISPEREYDTLLDVARAADEEYGHENALWFGRLVHDLFEGPD
ncbi:hypothetical protein [Actinocrinis sp.]|uniref:hypothetical protein n=1 Tax=Actinocrinis sp. TaxID=1920516 RepID=UPI002DDD9B74|nr:hypothetical protein [Actinocrinis sp.]